MDGTKLAGNAAMANNHTLPQIEKMLAEAAEVDAAEDAAEASAEPAQTPAILAPGADRRARRVAARDRLAAEDAARREVQRAKQAAWDAAANDPTGRRPGGRRTGDEPRTNRNNTPPRANITDRDCRVMRGQRGYIAGYNGRLVVTDR